MSTIPRTAVTSSNIASIGYDPATQDLDIEFKSRDGNRVYRYAAVPADAHAALMASPSVGSNFAREIRGRFASVQLPPAVQPT